MLRTCMCVPVDGGYFDMCGRVLLIRLWLLSTLLLTSQRILPSLFKQVWLLGWRRDGSCDLRAIFRLQVSAPRFHHSRHMAAVHSCQPSNQNTRVETSRSSKTYLGAYVRANMAASGMRCVFTRMSIQPFVSASWNNVANAMLFWPFSPIRGIKQRVSSA